MARISIIGSGFSGLSAACYLSAAGHEVHVFEKNDQAGGRARQIKTENGFVFDMGPSWYWMPDVYEKFFADFGYKVSDFYQLDELDPAFDVVFGENDTVNIPANFDELGNWFESIEPGSKLRLAKFMEGAQFKYEKGMEDLVYKPGLSLREFADMSVIKGAMRLQILSSFSKHVRKYFTHPKLLALMEFPVLFLGAMPQDTPALYSLMNYAGLKLGTWYPQGGFGSVVEAFVQVAKNNGVQFHFNSPVEKIVTEGGKATSLLVNGETIAFDGVIASADYHHVECDLIAKEQVNYSEKYWSKKTFAPSCLIYYLGVSKKIKSLNHHTLFFEEDFSQHAIEIYKDPKWPTKPLFYVCCPSKTDVAVAPENHENLFLLMPIAPGIEDNEATREKYFNLMMERLEKVAKEEIAGHIVYKKSYCVKDFIADYNSYKGNAYGLANTLMQTAIFKPKVKNYKIDNLFYTGQLTVPGPGVPPTIISGKIAADLLTKRLKSNKNEITV
ncbi:MAG: oleate hydratase [Bacteroidota bacterium]